MSTLAERLKQARAYLGLTQDEMADALGAKKRGYQENESGNTTPRSDVIAGFVTLGINANWLLTGQGEMLLNDNSAGYKQQQDVKSSVSGQEQTACITKEQFDEEYVLVPGYHIQVSTGNGSTFQNEEVKRMLAFRRKYLNYRQVNPERLAVVFSKGDSMEPTIKDNDSLLIDLDSIDPKDGKIYVVRLGDDLYAKRIQRLVDGGLVLISDNKEYQSQSIPPERLEQLQVIGQVIWIGKDV